MQLFARGYILFVAFTFEIFPYIFCYNNLSHGHPWEFVFRARLFSEEKNKWVFADIFCRLHVIAPILWRIAIVIKSYMSECINIIDKKNPTPFDVG